LFSQPLLNNIGGGFLLENFNQIEGVWGAKRRVGDCGETPAHNLPYENRNGTGLISFLQKK